MKKSILLIAVIIALIAVGLVACGKSDDGKVSDHASQNNAATDVSNGVSNAGNAGKDFALEQL